jgi:lipoate-protein ligase B
MKKVEWCDIGRIGYREAMSLQESLKARRQSGAIGDMLLLLEHDPVYTMGKRNCEGDIRSDRGAIATAGIDIVKTNRGGRVTYHGPGQLVGYFIFDLNSFAIGVKEFVHRVEEICIMTLNDFGLTGQRDADHPGVWLSREKVAAIGLNVDRGITMHGFALNVDCDLMHYKHIVACGIGGRGATSIKEALGSAPSMDEVKSRLIANVGRVMGCGMEEVSAVPQTEVNVSSSSSGGFSSKTSM